MLNYISDFKINHLMKRYIDLETPYQFQKIIGKGSYGVAYLLVHKDTGIQYVLKRMRTKHSGDERQKRKFKQEVTMLKLLGLPNVPKLVFEGELEGIPFYIMDFIDGNTFEQEIFHEGKVFSLEKSFIILEKLFEVVIKLHERNIVHRDLRIPNILIKNDIIYIIDFGLASYINSDVLVKEIENPKTLEDHRSDLYFIGHFLLFLLYSTYSPNSRKERSWQEELQLPDDVKTYIERLLLIGPAFSSAEEARQSIPSFINGAVP
ncbi:serine/threonine protein kinase [Ureibacillus sp. MALMAid1270]|uniref:serine/threonine protein kinase n=1 Tax=Ureibacillus sp. MALMAid1270 TaxID=3411629 RepID=UPI003BA48FAE